MTAVVRVPLAKRLGFLYTARKLCIVLASIYALLVVLGTTPFAQGQLIFMHNLKIPFFAQYDMPEKYDLARTSTGSFQQTQAQHEHIVPLPLNSRDNLIRSALRAHPTILFLHGTVGTRAMRVRVQHYLAFAARLRANVLAPDYRGFGDSTGTPSEEGVVLDARAAWDWLRARGAHPSSVLVVGSSLGTGVAVQFASALEEEAARFDDAGRDSDRSKAARVWDLRETAWRGASVPVQQTRDAPRYVLHPRARAAVAPSGRFLILPQGKLIGSWEKIDFIKGLMIHRFDSLAKVVNLKAPLLIVHAEDDLDIPVWHAQMLFDAFLEKHLPPLPELTPEMMAVMVVDSDATPPSSSEVAESVASLLQERAARRRELVRASEMERVGP
ncbi:Alpha/Beta hydrolase protein [Lactarius quietus]|nr:Alpha/Beta hydrolase protein [Lactarius quietus]